MAGENNWDGLDPEVRAQAAAAAEALGVSLDEYLTELLLETAVETIMSEEVAAAAPRMAAASAPPVGKSRENFAVRRRLDALERRITQAVGSLDQAINTVDGSVLGLAQRVDENEAVFGETAETLGVALTELSEHLGAVRDQLVEAEGGLAALNVANSAAHAEIAEKLTDLDQRLNVTDDIARDADRAGAELSLAQELLKQTFAEDLSAFSEATTIRVSRDLDQVRAAADAAARHADASAAHVINELRALRESIEARFEETTAETQAKMHAAFADTSNRHIHLASRVDQGERIAAETGEHLRARLIDIEDAAQTALEETADTLRRANSTLAADIARVSNDSRASIEHLRTEAAQDIAGLRDANAGVQSRLKLVDSAIANTLSDVAGLRDTIERRVGEAAALGREEMAKAREMWSGRFDALASRLTDAESDTAHAHQIAMAETHRVEACTLAALDKQAQDRAALENVLRMEMGDAAHARSISEAAIWRDLNELTKISRAQSDDLRQKLETTSAAMRGQQAGVQARVDAVVSRLDEGDVAETLARVPALETMVGQMRGELAAERPTDRAIATRLTQIEATLADDSIAKTVMGLCGQVATVAERLDVETADTRVRLTTQEGLAAETADGLHGLVRLFGRLSSQSSDATAQSEERLHKVELALADLRLEQYAEPAAETGVAMAELRQRVAEMEEREAAVFGQLRDDITHFLGENDRRLCALEAAGDLNLVDEFQGLRQRVEERLVEAERKSIRTLEQIMETVALLSRKFSGAPIEDAPAAKSA